MKVAVLVIACITLVVAQVARRQVGPLGYELPSGVEIIVGAIKGSFSCEGRIYGYYADVDTNCKIFHVCVPILNNEGVLQQTAHYSFGCGNLTVFDQENLVCVHDGDYLGCKDAPSVYDSINSRFGITDRP